MESIYQKIPFRVPVVGLSTGTYVAQLLNRATGVKQTVSATLSTAGTTLNFDFTSSQTGNLSVGIVCLMVYAASVSVSATIPTKMVHHDEKYAYVYETKIS